MTYSGVFFKLIIFIYIFAQCNCSEDAKEIEVGSQRKLCPPMLNVSPPPDRQDTKDIIERLRKEMRKQNSIQGPVINAYLITSDDEHQSEFVHDRDKRLKFISGFSGSAGLAIVTENKTALWTDGRYHAQADNELSCDWLLMGRDSKTKTVADWLKDEIKSKGRIGADPKLVSNSQWEKWNKDFSEHNVYLLPIKTNLVDLIWPEESRANYSNDEAYMWDSNYTGKSWQNKVGDVRREMKYQGCDAMVVTALDEIAWLLNIRGRDIPYNPVVRSYVILTKDQIHLYVDQNKLSQKVIQALHADKCYNAYCVRLHDYDSVWDDLRTFSQIWEKVLLPSENAYNSGVSRAVFNAIPVDKRKFTSSPIVALKSVKNVVERDGMRKAHIRDAAAFCDCMHTIEFEITNNIKEWTELDVADKLENCRTQQKHTRGISFPSIVGFGPHGALPHYVPNNVTNSLIDKSNLLVIDSGGHYLDGSTDLTRTFHFGTPTDEQIHRYTRVLMGHIDLASFKFPTNFPMNSVDILARSPLWQNGMEYNHGTGHGIGVFLNIHEAPINLNWKNMDNQPFKEGYFFTDEPGYYKEGDYGIRLENVLEVIKKEATAESTKEYFQFDTVSLVPFERKLINLEMLSPTQKHWLNNYNKRIRNEVGIELKKSDQLKGYQWMISKSEPIPVNCVEYNSAKSFNTPIRTFVMLIFLMQIINYIYR